MDYKTMNFAIRVTDNCNLNCDYCYAKVKNPKDMSIETLENVLNKIADFCTGDVTISWTGGEPLFLEKVFFEKIIETQKKIKNINFTNIIQTNLTLLNEGFIRFFSENNFQIRTSLDLPPQHHDSLRIKNNFAETLERIRKLQEANVKVNINTVITSRNVHSAKEIYHALKEYKITSFSVSRFILQGNAIHNIDLMIQEEGSFGKFLIELFDLWTSDKEGHLIQRITPLDNLINACKFMLNQIPKARPCFHCQDQVLAIGPLGDVYPSCNKFFAFPETCFGNLSSNGIGDILNSEKRNSFIKKVKSVTGKICPNCKYAIICKGGCFYLAYSANLKDNIDRESFCKGYFFVFDHIINYLKELKENE